MSRNGTIPLMRSAVLALFVGIHLACAGAIDNASCEQTGVNSYRISFQAGSNDEIAIYASSHADRIDSRSPLLKTRSSPVEVTVPSTGRVYFHLKPRSGPVRVVSVRRLPLEGSTNFRDLGGYSTAGGRHVRWGAMYRSGKLSALTARDYEYLAGLGLEMVCDFRVDSERRQSPTIWQGFPRPVFLVNTIDSYGNSGGSSAAGAASSGAQPARVPRPDYWWVEESSAQFALTFRRIAAGDLPMVFHCAAGKDRTGVMAALLLTGMGVPRDVARADYLLSNTYLVPDSKIPELAANIQKRQQLASPPDADTVRRLSGGVDRRWIDSTFQMIDRKYGSVEAYLYNALKLTPAELMAIRNRLLEP